MACVPGMGMHNRIFRVYVHRASLGYNLAWLTYHNNNNNIKFAHSCTAVPFMWGLLRLAPTKIYNRHTNSIPSKFQYIICLHGKIIIPLSWWIIIKFNTSLTDIFVSRDNNRRLAILCDIYKIDLHITLSRKYRVAVTYNKKFNYQY